MAVDALGDGVVHTGLKQYEPDVGCICVDDVVPVLESSDVAPLTPVTLSLAPSDPSAPPLNSGAGLDPRAAVDNVFLGAAKPVHGQYKNGSTNGLAFMFKGQLGTKPCMFLLDTGATYSFVDEAWLKRSARHKFDIRPLAKPTSVLTATSVSVPVTHVCLSTVRIQQLQSQVCAKVLPNLLHGVDVILGMDWLMANGAVLDCVRGRCSIMRGFKTIFLQGCTPVKPIVAASAVGVDPSSDSGLLMSAKQAARALRKGARGWLMMVQCDGHDVSVHDMPATDASDGGVTHDTLCAARPAAGSVSDGLVSPDRLEAILNDFKHVFSSVPGCPPERAIPHVIREEPGSVPPYRRMYRMTREEEAEVKRQVTSLLEKDLIEPSASPYGAPVLFVAKKDGTLRMCIDYRALNKQTIRDRYPLPDIQSLIDKLHGCTVFSGLDMEGAYHQIRIAKEDVPKTAFLTPQGQFQFKVLCFGLCNAPSTFQRVMNHLLRDCADFACVYLDDILVFSKDAASHEQHLRKVLTLLSDNKFYLKLSKCDLNKSELKYLGHIIGRHGVAADPAKVQQVLDWSVPRSLAELRKFLGLSNYFRRFIADYSSMVAALTSLTSNDSASKFNWSNWPATELAAFNAVKMALASAPVLALPDLNAPFELSADASLFGTGGVLMQAGRVIAYTSSKFSKAEQGYTTQEQELLALIRALQVWRCYIEGPQTVTLITDHNPLVAIQTQKNLSRRMARWVLFLQRFNFSIQYRPGKFNVADPLSRNPHLQNSSAATSEVPGPAPASGPVETTSGSAVVSVCGQLWVLTRSQARAEAQLTHPSEAVPSPASADPSSVPVSEVTRSPEFGSGGGEAHHTHSLGDQRDVEPFQQSSLLSDIKAAYTSDPWFAEHDRLAAKGFVLDPCGLWLTANGRTVVPRSPLVREQVLKACHDSTLSGHPGITKTVKQIERSFWWPTLRADVEHYVRHCDACQRNKSSSQRKAGFLRPLSIPGRRWEAVSLDLITKLPKTAHKYDAILVVVDRLSKMVHLVPCTESMSAKTFARLFVDNVVRLHGIPHNITSDRGTHWNNQFWKHMCHHLGVKLNMSTAYHPETNGQTERVNRVVGEMLRAYIRPTQCDWDQWLSMAEFAINNSWHEGVQNTPFYLNYGQHPLTPATFDLPHKVPAAEQFSSGLQRAVNEARRCWAEAQAKLSANANAKRRDVSYMVGDQVLLNTTNLFYKLAKEQPGARKLMPRYVGPFTVAQLVGPVAVKLDLPSDWARIHNVFHVSLIKPYLPPTHRPDTQVVGPPPIQWFEGEPLYRVERLLAHRRAARGRGLEYLVHWEGYGDEHDSWEPQRNLLTCDTLVREYHAQLAESASG